MSLPSAGHSEIIYAVNRKGKRNEEQDHAVYHRCLALACNACIAPALTNGIAAEEEAPRYYIDYYRDAQKKQKVDLSEIADNAPVYYTLIPADGCFIYTLKTNGTYTDDEKMIFASSDRTVDILSLIHI